jgi:hypothetical protein
MDSTKEKTIEDLMSSIKLDSMDYTSSVTAPYSVSFDLSDSITLSSGAASDTITVSSGAVTGAIGGSGYAYSNVPNITISNGAYTTTSAFGNVWGGNPLTANKAGQLDLEGEEADIKINGKSLMRVIEALEQRLNILTPNPKLEADWDELRELGERYRALEKQCEEKAAMWEKLKSMPAPDIT